MIANISLIVVINGPDATAGSTFILLKIKGTALPTKLAKVIAVNNEIPTIEDAINASFM